MEKILVNKWNERYTQIKNAITTLLEEDSWNVSYTNILKVTLKAMFEDSHIYDDEDYDYASYYCDYPDYENIHVIDDGDYQGMLLFAVPEDTYQPDTYWMFRVFYGSCSYCDTLQGILFDEDNKEQQVADLMTLALHMIQSGKVI